MHKTHLKTKSTFQYLRSHHSVTTNSKGSRLHSLYRTNRSVLNTALSQSLPRTLAASMLDQSALSHDMSYLVNQRPLDRPSYPPFEASTSTLVPDTQLIHF